MPAASRPKDIIAERALRHALSELARTRAERDAADARLGKSEDLVEFLISTLPAEQQPEFRERFAEIKSGTPQRGGKAFGQVIQLFKNNTKIEWTEIGRAHV